MKKKTYLIIILSALSCLQNIAFAQQFDKNPNVSLDTVRVKGDRFIFIGENAFYVKSDTVFLLPDTLDFHIKKNNMDRSDRFYTDVEQKMSKSKVSSLMYDFLFKSNQKNEPHGEESSAQRFTPYENETIQSINYKFLNPFGTDINDTTKNDPSKWTKHLNSIHVHTRKWVLKKNTLFDDTGKVNADLMINTERLLRRLDYIKDVRVLINESNQKADVAIAVKDVFPYNFLLRPNNNNNALFGISNINIAGIGHEIEYNKIKTGGSEFYYRIRNLEGTFIDSEFNYSDHFQKSGFGVFYTKDFLTQDTKYAGGISHSRYKFGELAYDPISDITSEFTYNLNNTDFWAGRAFNTSIVSNVLGLKENTKAVASARIEHFDFFDRPTVSENKNYRFHDKTDILFSLGLTSRIYYKDKFILQYGRLEDIPTGSALGLVAGYQVREFGNRLYFGFNYARGGYIPKFGYLNAILSIGSFVNHEEINDGVLKIGADYFTKLFSFNQFKFRQFINISLAQTIDPTEDVTLMTQSDIGIRGVSSYYHKSTTNFNIKMESLLFTPVNIVGFKMAVFGFLDYTKTNNNRNAFFGTDSYIGMGGGVRLRNDNLAISTIQIRLGYYPNTPLNAAPSQFSVATSTSLNIRDFDFKAPEIVSFK